MKGENTLENAVAACNPCHRFLDELALKREIFYDEQRMRENVEYVVGLLNSPHLDNEPVAWGNLAADD